MKKTEISFIIAASFLSAAIIVVIILKFILPGKGGEGFNFSEFEKINVIDMKGNQVRLADLMKKDEVTYCMIFELTNCYSCLRQGIEDLKTLQKSGKACLGLVVNDSFEDAAGWCANHDFSPFSMIMKEDFYERVFSQVLPVIVKMRNGKVLSFRYITI